MKIFSAAQIKELDSYTMQHEPVRSIDLMERASRAFADWFFQHYAVNARNGKPRVKIFCGMGNNGGDGLAVARMLVSAKYPVEVFAVRFSDKPSDDFRENEKRLRKYADLANIREAGHVPPIAATDVVIDAIFGSGLSRPASGLPAAVIDLINKSGATTVAIDMPSGLFTDQPSTGGSIVKAAHTVSFQLPKMAFMMPRNGNYVGQWHVVDIKLSQKWIEQAETAAFYLDAASVKNMLVQRQRFAHKGHFGHALLMGGSFGKIGAAVLMVKAALRSGAGLVTACVPGCGYQILQQSVPEAMCLTDPDHQKFTTLPDLSPFSCVAIGPGMGKAPESLRMLEQLLEQAEIPLVLDADALNLLGENRHLLEKLPANSVLTPHPGEFKRLAGDAENDFEQLRLLQDFTQRYQVITLLKGAHTAVALPSGRTWFNATGNPGMATGGSGDTLTGIIAGLLAQKSYPPETAAKLGVYLHGLAGDLALEHTGFEALAAGDLVTHLGPAFKELY